MGIEALQPEEIAALLAGCGRGEQSALAMLYERMSPVLLGCLMRILRRRALAEEALQDVFIQIWQRAAQFDAHRGRPVAWIIAIARYRAIDILRRERADNVDPFLLAESLTDAAEDDPSSLPGDTRTLEDCLQQLAAEQRESIRLAYLTGQSHPQIATALNRPLGTVKSWIRRGLVALRECIEACATRTAS